MNKNFGLGRAVLALGLGYGFIPASAANPIEAEYQASHESLPAAVIARINDVSWRKGCPVPLEGLSYLRMSHWDFDGGVRQGEMVVADDVAAEVTQLFGALFAAKFPIERMRLVSAYGGSDDASMAANNTSSFNCRWLTGRRDVYSKHSYGRAIDINPLVNPYVTKNIVQPPAGINYVDRSKRAPGMVGAGDACHQAFTSRGWRWGGAWRSLKDYQHFEKSGD